MSPKDTVEPDPFQDDLPAQPDGYAETAVIRPTFHELEARVAQLEEALASHAVVDQARGVLMAAHRIDPEAAWSLLVRVSSHENIKVRSLAESVIRLVTEPNGADPAGAAALRYLLPRGWSEGTKPG